MPPSRSHIRATVEEYLTRHPSERTGMLGMLALLDGDADPTSRTTLPGHLTCSAVVMDRHRRVLHIDHRTTGLSLAPGGHIEDDRTLLAAAVREVREETGLGPGDLCLTPDFLGAPIDIDVHDIGPRPDRGEAAHQHFDVRYVFYLVPEEHPPLTLQDEEVGGAQWRALTDVSSASLRTKLLQAALRGLDGQPEPLNASALLHNGSGCYLLHLRDNRPGIWEPGVFSLLGGGREAGDSSLKDTLRRELAEEAPGLQVEDLTPYAVEEATSPEGLAVPIQVFTGRWSGHPDTAELQEGVLLGWFAPDMLDRLRLSPGLGDLIRQHAAEQPEHPAAEVPPATVRRPLEEAPAGTELHIVGVHLYLQDESGRILLGLRHPDSAHAGSTWHFLAGHCEREAAISCLIREAKEEAGLIIAPGDVELVHLVHLANTGSARPRIQLVFRVRSWAGVPQVLEPDRCVEWRFWTPKDLPNAVVPYTREAIDGIGAGRLYTQMGW